MNKEELIDSISSQSHLTKADSKKAVDSFIIATSIALKKGKTVDILGFGRFDVRHYKTRTWKNKKGRTVVVPARNHVRFVESDNLGDAIN